MEGISFIGSYSFYWKLFILVEIIPFSENHFRQWKPFLLGKAFVFLGNHCPQLKPFCLVEAILFLEEAALFNRNFSFQWKPFFLVFQHFRQQKLSPVTRIIKYIVSDCDVRLLKMTNSSCIPIPIELFQSSEAYSEP